MKEQPQPQPPTRRIIERPRLLNQLEQTDASTILLIAPAGYGKTTLLRQWASRNPACWWFTAAPSSTDIAQLATGLAGALDPLSPGLLDEVSEVVRALSNPSRQIRELINPFANRSEDFRGKSAIIDDYQLVVRDSAADRFVRELCDRLKVKLLVGSRERPSWATARATIYGDVLELSRDQLALTPEEGADVLGDMPSAFREAFLVKAEGWPAVVGLAAVSNSHRRVPDDAVSVTLFQFFAEELFAAAPPQLQADLLTLALLPLPAPALISAHFGERTSALLLAAAAQGFITISEQEPDLHPLIREYLLSKVALDSDAENLVAQAVTDSLQIEEWDNAFGLIRQFDRIDLLDTFLEVAFMPLARMGRVGTLEDVAAYARSRVTEFSSPVTLIAAELALRDGSYRRAEELAVHSVRGLGSHHVLAAHAHWIAGQAAHLGARYTSATRHYRRAHKTARDDNDTRDALWGLLINSIASEIPVANEVAVELQRRRDLSPIDLLLATNATLLLRRYTSGFAKPLEVESAMHNLDVVRNPRVRTSFTYNLSYERFLQAHYNEAFRVSELTREQATKYQLSWALAHADWVLAAASLGVRDFVQADRCLRRVERAGNDLEDPFVALNAAALRARLHLVLQRIDEAEEALSVIDHRAVNPAMKAEVKALRALVFALRGDVKSAIAEAEEANAMTTAIEVHAYVACAHAVIPATNECATKPLRMARQFNVWDPLVTTVRAHPPLLKRLACDGRSHAQLQSVLRRSNDFDLARWAGIPLGKRPKRERTLLSPREREVIELVSQGFTDKRIAEALFISRGTAKVHVRHILDKFGARSRAEAVARYTLGSE